jgi:hypothetical protein
VQLKLGSEKKDRKRITAAEMIFMTTAKCISMDSKINEDTLKQPQKNLATFGVGGMYR